MLLLPKDEGVELGAAIGVMETAGISAKVALNLMNSVNRRGKAVVCQGRQEDMKLMARLFGEIGMKTSMQAGSAPHK